MLYEHPIVDGNRFSEQFNGELGDLVYDVLGELNSEDRKIITLHFGLYDPVENPFQKTYTLGEMGEINSVSGE